VKSNAAIATLLALLTAVVFWGVTRCEFTNYDDPVFVTENYHVLGGLSAEGVKWAFTTSAPDYWRPLSWLSHQLDVELFGLNPAGHHVTNLLFHIGATVLLFLALRMMTGAVWPSAWVAALFAVHPLHVESVAWVAERKDVLNGFFWMLTLVAYAHYARAPGIKRYLLVLLAFALGLMSKPMAVTLPCVLLLLDFWPLKRFGVFATPDAGRAAVSSPRREPERRTEMGNAPLRRAEDSVALPSGSLNSGTPAPFPMRLVRLLAEKVPMFALAIALSALAFSGQQEVGVIVAPETLSFTARLANAVVSYVTYLRKTVWPDDLAVFYPHPIGWPMTHVAISIAVLLVLSGLVAVNWRKRPYLVIGWLWYLGTLVPAIGLVQVGAQAMADRYTYVPLVGVFIMLAWWAGELAGARTRCRTMTIVLGVAAIVASSAVTVVQVRYWRDSLTLWEHALEVAPDNALARIEIADALMRRGRLPEAETHLARAVALTPQSEHARVNYAIALTHRGQFAAAEEQVKEALRLKPDDAPAHAQLALVLAATGRATEALPHYREALRLKPDFLEAANNLAWLLATHPDDKLRDGAEAVRLAERACALTRWQTPAYVGTLAAAYAEAGRFTEAIATGERARELALRQGQSELAARNEQLLALYRAGRPAREAP